MKSFNNLVQAEKIFRSLLGLAMVILLMVQMVGGALEKAHCHVDKNSTAGAFTVGNGESVMSVISAQQLVTTQSDHEHHSSSNSCSDVGTCVFGHCHLNHGGVLVSQNEIPWYPSEDLQKNKVLKDNQKKSLHNLEAPWQPPRLA